MSEVTTLVKRPYIFARSKF